MLRVQLPSTSQNPRRVLCLGAHSDDIEIGCGATILRLIEQDPATEFYWLVFSASPVRRKEALASARLFLKGAARSTVKVLNYRDGFFPYNGARIKQDFERLKAAFDPAIVLTHTRHDLHQDHRMICELTGNTFRDHFVLEYEIPKYDGDLGAPNFFVHLDDTHARRKVEILLRAFASQRSKHWFTEDLFRGLMRIRGMESNAPGKLAEGFYCRKISW
jgi:LmbE family N-acetylglucosaminyl deacetylase